MGLNRNEHGRPWTTSGGGPVLVIPAETAAGWRGTLPPLGAEVPEGWTWGAGDGPECDYDRACGPKDYRGTPYGGVGWVEVGGKPAIVLDAEIVTEWFADPGGGTIVRSSLDDASTDVGAVPESAWSECAPGTIELTDGRVFMFDSAFDGRADPEAIEAHDGVGVIELVPGKYALSFASNADEVDFLRFRKL